MLVVLVVVLVVLLLLFPLKLLLLAILEVRASLVPVLDLSGTLKSIGWVDIVLFSKFNAFEYCLWFF